VKIDLCFIPTLGCKSLRGDEEAYHAAVIEAKSPLVALVNLQQAVFTWILFRNLVVVWATKELKGVVVISNLAKENLLRLKKGRLVIVINNSKRLKVLASWAIEDSITTLAPLAKEWVATNDSSLLLT
jgi:hypothetical protein